MTTSTQEHLENKGQNPSVKRDPKDFPHEVLDLRSRVERLEQQVAKLQARG